MRKKTLFIATMFASSSFAMPIPPQNNQDDNSNITFNLSSSKEIKSDLTILNISHDDSASNPNKSLDQIDKSQTSIKSILSKYPTIQIVNSNIQVITNYDKNGEVNNYTGNIVYSISDKNIRNLNNFISEIKDKDWKIQNIKYTTSESLKDINEDILIKTLNDKLKQRMALIKSENQFKSCSIKELNINRQSDDQPFIPMMFNKQSNSNEMVSTNASAQADSSGIINNNIINKMTVSFYTTLKCK